MIVCINMKSGFNIIYLGKDTSSSSVNNAILTECQSSLINGVFPNEILFTWAPNKLQENASIILTS